MVALRRPWYFPIYNRKKSIIASILTRPACLSPHLLSAMTQSTLAHGVHLVGSLPLSTSEEVFTTLPEALPNRLFSIPDGETGDRRSFIGWQRLRFPVQTRRENVKWRQLPEHVRGIPLPEGHSGIFTLDDVKPVRYDEFAKESYQTFLRHRQNGVIPPGVRFQVSLPTPYESIQCHVRPEFHAQLEPFYEQRIFDAVQSILSAIPAEDLVIQFDGCFMMTALEYERGRLSEDFFKPHFSPISQGALERALRLCAQVPSTVPVGWHLCYGDILHKHFVEPEDLGVMVDFANDLVQGIADFRCLSWLHMPVPKDRDDPEYFEPLKRLAISEDTKLYLGLVHANDKDGSLRRLQAARNALPAGKTFGVATECGMGRTPREELESILKISKDLTETVDSSE